MKSFACRCAFVVLPLCAAALLFVKVTSPTSSVAWCPGVAKEGRKEMSSTFEETRRPKISTQAITEAARQNAVLGLVQGKAVCLFTAEKLVDALMHLQNTCADTEADARESRRRVADLIDRLAPDQMSFHTLFNFRKAMVDLGWDPALAGNSWLYLDKRLSETFQMDGHMPIPILRASGASKAKRTKRTHVQHFQPPRPPEPPHCPELPQPAEPPPPPPPPPPRSGRIQRRTLVQAQHSLRNALRMKNYWKRKAKKLEAEKMESKQEAERKAYHKKSRKKESLFSKLSLRGGYRLALKRGLGHASAASLLLSIDDANVTDHALWPWERLLGANLMCQSRSWFRKHYERVVGFLESLPLHLSSLRSPGEASEVEAEAAEAEVADDIAAQEEPAEGPVETDRPTDVTK